MAISRRSYKGAPVSNTLGAGGLAANATTISLSASMSGWPTGSQPFFVVIDPGTSKEEKVCVKYSNATTLIVVDPAVTSSWPASVNGRGADDTTDRNHDAGATIYPVFTAVEANNANELLSAYTANGDLVVHGSSSFKKIGVGTNAHVLQADSSVTDGGVKWGQVATAGIADSAVTSAKIADGTIVLADLASSLQAFLVPVGTIQAYAGSSAPTGWLLCDGTSTSGYTALAALVGATTPDLRGKFLLGKTASGTGSTLLGSGGSTTIAEANLPSHKHSMNHSHGTFTSTGQSQSHTHTVTLSDPGHSHQVNVSLKLFNYANGYDGAESLDFNSTETTDSATTGITVSNVSNASQDHTHNVTVSAFTGDTGTVGSGTAYYQPFVAVSYIIKHD